MLENLFLSAKIHNFARRNKKNKKNMSVVLHKIIDEHEYCWYDSTNVLYSVCHDKKDDFKDVTLVFKGGRTYLYKNVDVNDYLKFRNSESQGKALRQYFDVKVNEAGDKKYQIVRLSDINLDDLAEKRKEIEDEMKKEKAENVKKQEDEESVIHYTFLEDNDMVRLYKDGNLLVSGISKSSISAADLLDALGIKYEVKSIRNKDVNPENSLI